MAAIGSGLHARKGTPAVIQTHAPKLVILGPQGAGKGTQGTRLSRHLDIDHISTGDLLRDAMANETPTGIEARRYMDAGELVPDDVVLRMLGERLGEPTTSRRGFLLDGFPRKVTQAEQFEAMHPDQAIDAAILLSLPLELVYRRLDARRVCGSCRSILAAPDARIDAIACPVCNGVAIRRADDTPDAIAQRLRLYKAETEPLVEYYSQRGVLVTIDGCGSQEAVFDAILHSIRPNLWGTGLAVG